MLATLNNRNDFDGDAGTRTWTYTFDVQSANDIELYLTDALGVTTQVTTSYSIDTTTKVVTYPTVVSGLAPIAVGVTLTVMRIVDLTQATDIVNQGTFDGPSLEAAYDKLTMICQQLNEKLNRATLAGITNIPASQLPALSQGFLYTDGAVIRWTPITTVAYSGVIGSGLEADLPAVPGVADLYIATDTQVIYLCKVAGAWVKQVIDGAQFTGLANIVVGAGVIPVANIPDMNASKITAGSFAAARIPNLDASKITTGTIGTARIDTGVGANKIVKLGADSKLPAMDGSNLTGIMALKNIQVFTATGTFTKSAGISKVWVDIVGAGGCGGNSGGGAWAAGGGGGGYCSKICTITNDITVTIGIASLNSAGGDSIFGHIDDGGAGLGTVFCTAGGGAVGTYSADGFAVGGTAVGGDINVPGGCSEYIVTTDKTIGRGGDSFYGRGGLQSAGYGYGAGGGSNGPAATYAGTDGICIVRW